MSVSPRRLRTGALALATLAVISTTACTAGGSGGNANSGEAKTLTVNTSFVLKTLDPGRVYEATGLTAVHALYDTLLTFEGSDVGKPVPALAESYDASPDAKTFTFKLRSGVTFADGSPLTADDVVFSLNRLKNIKGSPAVTVSELSVSKTDDSTVVVTSATPNPNVPVVLAMPSTGVLNAEVARDNGAKDGADAAQGDTAQQYLDTNSIGSGPYVLKSYEPESQVVLEANPNYWGDKPQFERVVLRNMDVQTQKLTMQRAETAEISLDISGKLLDGLPESLQTSGVQDTVYFLFLNADPAVSAVTANPKFNQALRAAIDYQGIAALYGEGAAPGAGLVAPAFPGTLPASEASTRDVAKAKALLAEAGLTDPTVKFNYPAITYKGVDLGTVATKVQATRRGRHHAGVEPAATDHLPRRDAQRQVAAGLHPAEPELPGRRLADQQHGTRSGHRAALGLDRRAGRPGDRGRRREGHRDPRPRGPGHRHAGVAAADEPVLPVHRAGQQLLHGGGDRRPDRRGLLRRRLAGRRGRGRSPVVGAP